jgi:cytochrome oxidase Cu insertion factor (SCO1/SenC/PrrC family)
MPGMGNASLSSTGLADPFYHRLVLEALVIAGIGIVLMVVRFVFYGAMSPRSETVAIQGSADATSVVIEPRGRAIIRYGFGALWIIDGLLQMQRSMPASLVTSVIQPTEQGEPHWLVAIVNWGTSAWERHPIWSASSAVWIQLAIGIWLILGRSGVFAKLGYLASALWGLSVWVFGESLGQILAPGQSWLFGAPGGVLFYVLAAAVLFLPWSWWSSKKIQTWILSGIGAELVLAAIWEAFPGRGFWRWQIPSMIKEMAGNSQPKLISGPMFAVARDTSHIGWLMNLIAVLAMLVIGVSFLLKKGLGLSVPGFVVFSLLTWWFLQDFGVLGGVGTDPNSMIPQILLVSGAYIGLSASEAVVAEENGFWPALIGPAGRLFGIWTVAVALIGAIPMGYSVVDQTYSVQSAVAASGAPFAISRAAPNFTLVDQYGKPFELSNFAGKRIVLTNLDPTCTDDCPLIASEIKQADLTLPPAIRRDTIFVAIASNPILHSVEALQVFDQREGMTGLRNFYYVTSPSLAQLQKAWDDYEIGLSVPVNGVMVVHPDLMFLIRPGLKEKWLLPSGPSTETSVQHSFSALVDQLVESL